jgi:hypothetical protein
MLGLAGSADAATYDTRLTRAPYLTDLVGMHVIVNFATDTSRTMVSVRYGPFDGTSCSLQVGEAQTGRTYDVVFDDTAFGSQRIGP